MACRLPDEYTSPTNAIKLTEEYTITTSADGYAVFSVAPALSRAKYTNAVTVTAGVASTAAITYTAHPDYTTFTTNFLYARTVAMQITISYIAPPMTASGRLIWIESGNIGATTNVADLSTLLDDGESTPLIDGKIVRPRPTQTPRLEDSTMPAFGYATWPVHDFIIVGALANAPVVSVRVTRHVEAISLKNAITRGEAKVEPFNPDAMAMSANMGTAGKSGPSKAGSAMSKAALGAAEVAWAALGPQVSTAVTKYGASAATWATEALMALM